MQVLAGKYKGRRLQSSLSPKVRPTARRLRESLFELLGLRLAGARFLDLCAGSGAVGIEALSRGAQFATFVDRSPKMCGFINANLELCGVASEQFNVTADDAARFLKLSALEQEAVWDIAFFDPPYATDYHSVIELFEHKKLLHKKGSVLIVEHHCENVLPESYGALRRWRVIRQGASCLSFYERKK
jgi:16S rRNA (guanine(966)-N(2))-methyltransferase RsmD